MLVVMYLCEPRASALTGSFFLRYPMDFFFILIADKEVT